MFVLSHSYTACYSAGPAPAKTQRSLDVSLEYNYLLLIASCYSGIKVQAKYRQSATFSGKYMPDVTISRKYDFTKLHA